MIKTSLFQSLCKYISKPSVAKNFDNFIPPLHATFATGIYIKDIYNSDLPKKSKDTMAIHDILAGGGGILLSIFLNKRIKNFETNVIKNIEKSAIPNITKICGGIRVAVPIIITSAVMRYINPVIAIPLAEKIKNGYLRIKKRFGF